MALASSGIAIRVTIERPIPTGLLAGWSPLASVMVASTVTYAASSQNVIAISCWARRSAVSESARAAVEAPEHDDPGERLDQRVGAERDQRDRPGDGAGGDRDGRLDAVPDQAAASEQTRAGLEPFALGVAVAGRWGLGGGVDDGKLDGHQGQYAAASAALLARWPELGLCPLAVRWLVWQQRSRPLAADGRGVCAVAGRLPAVLRARATSTWSAAGRAEIAGYVRDLRERPGRHGANVVALDSGAGLANATLQLRVTVVRLFYDFLVEERRPGPQPGRSRLPRRRRAGWPPRSGAAVPGVAVDPDR